MAGGSVIHLPEIWASHARQRPDHPALIAGAARFTWAELGRRMDCVAARLVGAGLRRGDRVAYLVPNGIEALSLTMGVLRAGCVVVPLLPLLTAVQLSRQVADCGARAFVAFGAVPEPALPPGCARLDLFAPSDDDRSLDGADAVADAAGGDPAAIIYSSGTTGMPKGIVHSRAGRREMAMGMALAFGFTPASVALVATPIASNATWLMLMPALLMGATVVWMPSFEPAAWLATVAGAGATHAIVVPAMLHPILATTAASPDVPTRLRAVVSVGSALGVPLAQAAAARFGPVVHELYGTTEGVGTIRPADAPPAMLGTVGQAIVGTEVAVLTEDGRLAEPGVAGEVVGRGPATMLGYFDRPDESAAAIWTDPTGRDWLRTGDIGRMDARGILTLLDRKKDMILSGGINVYPSDIESVLAAHPDIAEVAVIGVPDARWGEVPCAVVRLAAPVTDDAAAAAALAAWADARLAKHQRLSRIVLRETKLPRNALGKIMKTELRADHARGERSPAWAR